MAHVKLHPDYMLLKTKFMTDALPTSDVLADHVTFHYDTILAPRATATHTANAAEAKAACAIANDRRTQEERKRQRLAVKVPCSVCHRPGHPAKDCFMTYDEKREQFLKKASSSAKAAFLKRVADYKKHGKLPLPGEHLSAAAGQSDLCPGLEDNCEVLFALSGAGQSGVHPGLEDTGESLYALHETEHSDLHSGLAETGDWTTAAHGACILDRGTDLPRGIERVISVKKIICKLHVIREIAKHMEKLLQLEPVMVRTSLEDLKDWASGLGQTTRALIRAVESYGTLIFDITGGCGTDDGPRMGMAAIPATVGGWASGIFTSGMSNSWGSMPDFESASDSDSDGMSYSCDSIPDLDSGSNSDDDVDPLPSDTWACGVCRTPAAHRVAMVCGAHVGRARPRTTVGRSVVLDSGSTKHIFNSVDVLNKDYAPKACETFKVVQSQAVSSTGSGSVTFAKRDIQSGRMVGLQLLGAHCIPGHSFNLLSVVALEDVGFLVDFGARTHDGDQRDRFDWKFEDTEPHFTTHGPFFLEIFASENNHILNTYCTLSDTCFIKDWAGKHCYGNPPFDHDIILKCLQKALADFDRDPANTKFMFVLPKWVTANWWHLTTHFSIVHEYPAGANIFSATMASCYNVANLKPCGEDRVWIEDTKWPVVVLFKDSQTVEQLDLKMLQHVRLGQIGDKSDDHMFAQNVPMGISESQYSCTPLQHCPERCIACKLTKAIRPLVKPTGRELSKELGSLVWPDTCGPFRINGGGYRWFARFVDDSTTWICIYFLKHKSDYLEAFKLYIVEVKRLKSGMGLPEDHHMFVSTSSAIELVSFRYMGHSEVSFAYLLYDHDFGKVVNSGMVTFSERLDKLGKVGTTWDPSALAPLKTDFMATTLDAPYRDPLPALLETPVLEQGVYLPEDGGEVMAVVKVEASDDAYWVSLSSYLEPGQSLLQACPTYGHINAHYPLFTEVRAVTGKGDSEEAMICGRVVEPHAQPYCVVLLTNFTVMDLPAGNVHVPPAHTCLGVKSDTTHAEHNSMLPEEVTELKGHPHVLLAPDSVEWLDSIQDELEALVQIKGALLMMKEEDVPVGVKLLDMSLILKVKLDKHKQLLKRKSRICVRGNKQECAKLLKAVYGVKQAGREWFDTSDAFIMGYDSRMQRSDVEPCLYFIKDTEIMVIILALWMITSLPRMGGAREVRYILNVLDSLVSICRPVPMYCDNQGAIHLASDYVNNSRSKHIEVRNMYIRELIKARETKALYTGTADNTSDIMTKPLALPTFRVHKKKTRCHESAP
eukprot:gene8472-biopygen8591